MKKHGSLGEDMQETFMISAGAAVNTVLELEPRMAEMDNDELTLEFQKDGQGIKGDVRDIVIKRKDIEWEVGLSIKHNHDAVKHSRLSYKLVLEMNGLICLVLMNIGMQLNQYLTF